MKAKLLRDFTCYPPENPSVKRTFLKGTEVDGTIARWAMAVPGSAELVTEDAPAKAAPKTKAAKKAPENK